MLADEKGAWKRGAGSYLYLLGGPSNILNRETNTHHTTLADRYPIQLLHRTSREFYFLLKMSHIFESTVMALPRAIEIL